MTFTTEQKTLEAGRHHYKRDQPRRFVAVVDSFTYGCSGKVLLVSSTPSVALLKI